VLSIIGVCTTVGYSDTYICFMFHKNPVFLTVPLIYVTMHLKWP